MIHKMPSPLPHHVRVTFELPADLWAGQVYLVGDFNQWSPRATPLVQDRAGVWRATLDLPVGARCEFRYWVDGEWKTDYRADNLVASPFGSDNSVVIARLVSGETLHE